MLKIRLQKTGKKNQPSYRIVLCEHTSPPQGKFIEILGSYNARLKKKNFKKERIEHWISQGAQPSPTVYNLLVDEGILKGIKLKAWRPKKKKKEKPVEKPVEEAKPASASEEVTSEAKEEKPKEEPKPEEAKKEESKPEEKLKGKKEVESPQETKSSEEEEKEPASSADKETLDKPEKKD